MSYFAARPGLVCALFWLIALGVGLFPAAGQDVESSEEGHLHAVQSTTAGGFDELQGRLGELREEYAPYLRSLPAPLSVRHRTPLGSVWRTKFEIERADDGKRPAPPDWYRKDFDDADWEETTVPEWRYAGKGYREPVSCILWYRTRFSADVPEPSAAEPRRTFLVFEGVDWEAEVWLNGKRLGRHAVYYEPFRFDVTGLLEKENTLAVRVIDGPLFGEPRAYWSLLPMVPAQRQRYVRERGKSLDGYRSGDLHIGSGFGIHRDVYLETTGETRIDAVFARSDPATQQASVIVETDAVRAGRASLEVEILPENFEGRAYRESVPCDVSEGSGRQSIRVAMPGARVWTPETPWLYRCRVVFREDTSTDRSAVIDAKDVVFGCRSFDIVSRQRPREGLPEGMFLLNGKPFFLRGTNIQGLNALWYWGETDRLIDIVLLLKAGHFNAVRFCQHVGYPEVRELLDRLGILSEQDQGSGRPSADSSRQLARAGRALARVCYNNPGVVLLSFGNETAFDPTRVIEAALAVDPQRILIPISGNRFRKPPGYPIPEALWANVVNDYHAYSAWYSGQGTVWTVLRVQKPRRLRTAGEYGAEALDGYETMARRYPDHWPPTPSAESDTLWAHVQVEKADIRQMVGFRGKRPRNLGEYIEASQTYQADVLAEDTKGFRLSPRAIGGNFQFHFVDVLPANWPKAIVSHDLVPKKAYYAMAQVNQPLVPLFEIVDRGGAMGLWVANDQPEGFPQCRVRWTVEADGKTLLEGARVVDVAPSNATEAGQVDLSAVPDSVDVVVIRLELRGASGEILANYEQEVFLRAWRERDEFLKAPEK